MTRDRGKNKDTYDTVNTPLAITLNSATYTDLLPANPDRFGYTVSDLANITILIKEKASGEPDSADRGFAVFRVARVGIRRLLFPILWLLVI